VTGRGLADTDLVKHLRGPIAFYVGLSALPLVVVVLLWTGSGSSGDEPTWDSGPGGARYFNLPNGKAQIGVSGYDARDIVVRWRDADGKTWTDPEKVYDAGDMIRTYMRVRVGGPTLALFATFTPPDTSYSDDIPYEELIKDDVTVFVVCRDGTCAASEEHDGLASDPPQVTPDGAHVLLGAWPDGYVTWHGDGIVEQEPSGLPDGTYGDGQPLLAPDGSLRAVHGENGPAGCDFTMLTTDPGGTDFREAAHYLDTGDRRDVCTTALETFSPDYLVVSRSKYDAWFLVRRGGTWRRVTEDPSGQVRYPPPSDRKLPGRYERSGYWHWREVIGTSPDGRTLVVQVHFPGAETWTAPRVVARAPKGSECFRIEQMPTHTWGEEDPFYINLTCRSRSRPGEPWVHTYPTAVTDDGRTWHGFLATDTGTRVGRDLVFRGNPTRRWSPGTGLRRVGLPTPPGTVLTLLADGTSAQSRLVAAPGGCTVEVRLAGPDDTSWSAPVRSTADPVPANLCTLDDVSSENKNIYHYFGGTPQEHRMVRLVWHDDHPVLENGPSGP
jgi:hypothetical protein